MQFKRDKEDFENIDNILLDFTQWNLVAPDGSRPRHDYYVFLFEYFVCLYFSYFIKENDLQSKFLSGDIVVSDPDEDEEDVSDPIIKQMLATFERILTRPSSLFKEESTSFMSKGVLDFNKMMFFYSPQYGNKNKVSYNISNYNIMLNVYNGLCFFPRSSEVGEYSSHYGLRDLYYPEIYKRYCRFVFILLFLDEDEERDFLDREKSWMLYKELLVVLTGIYDVTEEEQVGAYRLIGVYIDEFIDEMMISKKLLYGMESELFELDSDMSRVRVQDAYLLFIAYLDRYKQELADACKYSYNFSYKAHLLHPRRYNIESFVKKGGVDFRMKITVYKDLWSVFFERFGEVLVYYN